MPTPVKSLGPGPNGGTLVQMDDGTTAEIKGNDVTPAPQGFLARHVPGALAFADGALQGMSGHPTLFGAPSGSMTDVASQQDIDASNGANPKAHAFGETLGNVAGGVRTLFTMPQQAIRHVFPEVLGGDAGAQMKSLLGSRPGPKQAAPAAPQSDAGLAPGAVQLPAAQQQGTGQPGSGQSGFQVPSGPDYEKQLARGDAEARQAIRSQSDADMDKQHHLAALQEANYAQRAKDIQDYQAKQETFAKESAAREAELNKIADEISNAKVDPNHYWHSLDGNQKLVATISMALGAFGQSLTGHNGSPIQGFIDRDIQAQRDNFEAKKSGYTLKSNLYSQFRQRGASDLEATLLAQKMGYELASQKLQDFAQSSSDPQIRAKAQAQLAQLDQAGAMRGAELSKNVAETTNAKIQGAAAMENMKLAQAQREAMARGQIPPQFADRAVYLPNGKALIAPSKEDAEKLRTVHRASSDITQAASEMEKLVRANPIDVLRPGSEAHRRFSLLKDSVINQINASKGINAQMNDAQRELYAKGLDPTLMGSTDALIKAIQGFRDETRQSANKAFQLSTGQDAFVSLPSGAQPGVVGVHQ
jgi:hypothetical protein